MSYALKRILAVYGIFLFVLVGIGYSIYDTYFKVKPSCSDGIKNGVEEGVDCGGNCERICSFKAEKVNINWARPFEVTDGVYNIAASVENPNFNYTIDVDYALKYYNERNLDVGEKKGTITLTPLEKKIIFFPGIKVPSQKIKRVFFDTERIYNLKNAKEEEKKILVNSKEIIRENNLTKLKIILKNTDFLPHRHMQVTAVLFARDGNVIDINQTYLDYIDKNSESTIYMTWPKELPKEIANIKILIKEVKI